MEEEKQQRGRGGGVANIEQLRQELISGTKSHIEIIDSARLGTGDYDFYSIELIKEGAQATVFEIKSKTDGKTYEAKRLQYQIGNQLNTRII